MPENTKIIVAPGVEIQLSHPDDMPASALATAIPQVVKSAAEIIAKSGNNIVAATIAAYEETSAKIVFYQEHGRVLREEVIPLIAKAKAYQTGRDALDSMALDNDILVEAQQELNRRMGRASAKNSTPSEKDNSSAALLFPFPIKDTISIDEPASFVQITFDTNIGTIEQNLTTEYLKNTILPYLSAIADVQRVLDKIQNKNSGEVKIKSISQNSPISVSLDGASQAIQTIIEYVVPWKRKHAEVIAQLSISDKQAEIETKRAEVLEKRARATKDRAESEKFLAEIGAKKAETIRMELENEKLRLELQRAKIQMALDILKEIAPNIPETERVEHLLRLLPPLDVIIFSHGRKITFRIRSMLAKQVGYDQVYRGTASHENNQKEVYTSMPLSCL